jgi:hypothetical protein
MHRIAFTHSPFAVLSQTDAHRCNVTCLPLPVAASPFGGVLCRAHAAPASIAEEGGRRSAFASLRRACAAPLSSTKQMFGTRKLALATCLLIVIWFGVALGYYGVIIFNTELQVEDEVCVNGRASVSGGDYLDVFITTLGEVRPQSPLRTATAAGTRRPVACTRNMRALTTCALLRHSVRRCGSAADHDSPMQVAGLAVCLLLVDVLGRKLCLVLFTTALSAALLPFFRAGGPATDRPPVSIDVAMLFLSRMLVYASFIVIFIYTPEVYPTRIRSYAFGSFNAICRLGGLVAPFIGVRLFEKVRERPVASAAVAGLLDARCMRRGMCPVTRSACS